MLKQFFREIVAKIKVLLFNFIRNRLGLIIFKKKSLNSFLLSNENKYRSLLQRKNYSKSSEYKQLRSSIIQLKKLCKFKASKKDTFLFFHIQKTAGTSLGFDYIPKAFPSQYFNQFSSVEESIISRNLIMNMTNEEFLKLKIFFGHHVYLIHDLIPNAKLITFVRDPIKRAMSQYLYELNYYNTLKIFNAPRPFNKRPLPKNTEEFWKFFIKWGSRGYPHCNFNLQSSSILTFFNARKIENFEKLKKYIRTEEFEKLKKYINARKIEEFEKLKEYIRAFDFIGVQDEMNKSMLALNRKFKFPILKFDKKLVSPYSKLYPPESIKKEILNFSNYDNILYEYSRKTFLDK